MVATVIAGSSCKDIAYRLSVALTMEYSEASIERFADQELKIQLPPLLDKDEIIIVQSTCNPAHDHLVELLLLVDAAKHLGVSHIVVIIPYFCYSRQDKIFYEGCPIAATLMIKLLESSGVDHLITLDLHAGHSKGFSIQLHNIDPIPLIASHLTHITRDSIVVSPDAGSLMRAKKLADTLGIDYTEMTKKRDGHNVRYSDNFTKSVKNKKCILIDDIMDTGETLSKAAYLLKEKGAISVEAVVTHAVLSKGAIHTLEAAPIDGIITTNTISHKRLPSKFIIDDIVPLIATAYVKKI
jgi:ribose-phosphate pyrophosphokinase